MTAHVRLVKEFGGGVGVRDVGLIESALHRPFASYEGKLQYQTPFERAAVLWLGLIRNHGFVDANKRTATAAMARWLVAEGYRLRSGQDELVDMAVAMGNEGLEVGEGAGRVGEHSERRPNP